MTWEEVCDDPCLQDLPYKIELNKWGNIEMSPAKFYHSEFQGRIAYLLQTLKPDGSVATECAIETSDNTKVADVTWISYARRRTSAARGRQLRRGARDLRGGCLHEQLGGGANAQGQPLH